MRSLSLIRCTKDDFILNSTWIQFICERCHLTAGARIFDIIMFIIRDERETSNINYLFSARALYVYIPQRYFACNTHNNIARTTLEYHRAGERKLLIFLLLPGKCFGIVYTHFFRLSRGIWYISMKEKRENRKQLMRACVGARRVCRRQITDANCYYMPLQHKEFIFCRHSSHVFVDVIRSLIDPGSQHTPLHVFVYRGRNRNTGVCYIYCFQLKTSLR